MSSDHLCVIVGSGPGLSQAIARRFGKEGYTLALVARHPDSLSQSTQELQQQGIPTHAFVADAGDAESLVQAFDQIRDQLGDPGVLIYNAAALKLGSPLQLKNDDLIHDFQVNVAGALTSAQQVIPAMLSRQEGTILITGGGLALNPFPDYCSLSLGKAALRNLTISLAKVLEPAGIHVATLTITGFIEAGTRFSPELLAEEYWDLHQQPSESWERERVY